MIRGGEPVTISYYIEQFDFTISYYFSLLPWWLRVSIIICLICAIIGIIASHAMAIYKHREDWTPEENSNLMKSYLGPSGIDQCNATYKEAHTLLRDKTWIPTGPAGFAHRVYNKEFESKGVKTLCDIFVYAPCVVIGRIEMFFRVVFGSIWLAIAKVVQLIIIAFLAGISWIIMPIWKGVDKSMRSVQHCSSCYSQFNLPGFVCPSCGEIHKNLIPGAHGLLIARCKCGKFLPTTIITGRTKLNAVCPNCDTALAANNARQFSIQVFGGNSSGKTAFISAFQHEYLNNVSQDGMVTKAIPEEAFNELEDMYQAGVTTPSSATDIQTFNIVHDREGGFKEETMVLYDIPDEVLISGEYEKNPILFKYSKGLVIVIDPLSSYEIREAVSEAGEGASLVNYDEDDPGELIVQFIDSFSRVIGRNAKKMSNIPVAVVINRFDINSIHEELYVEPPYSDKVTNLATRREDMRNIVDEKCKDYLMKMGLSNAIYNLESVFSNIHYFPVSPIGHVSEEGKAFNPIGVLEPLEWMTLKSNSAIHNYIASALDKLNPRKNVEIQILKDDNMQNLTGIVINGVLFKNEEQLSSEQFYYTVKNEVLSKKGVNLDDYWVKEYTSQTTYSRYEEMMNGKS